MLQFEKKLPSKFENENLKRPKSLVKINVYLPYHEGMVHEVEDKPCPFYAPPCLLHSSSFLIELKI